MRLAAPALVAAHVVVIGLACREFTAPRNPPPEAVALRALPADSLSVAELGEVDGRRAELMLSIQENDRDLAALAELAHLYMRHGWFGEAIGPLARAVEVDPGRVDLFYELLLAVKLSGRPEGTVDFTEEARAFMEAVEMEGHGC
jgi:cytochrome c-type biogenesis protein CcmH/NrfG